jgi:hypothetical protein
MELASTNDELYSATRSKTPKAVVTTVRKLDELVLLEDGWDSYDAKSPSKKAIVGALQLSNDLFRPNTPDPDVFPVPNGNIQIEWSCQGYEIEIEVFSSTKSKVYFEDLNTGESWEEVFSYDLERLEQTISLLSSNQSRLALVS